MGRGTLTLNIGGTKEEAQQANINEARVRTADLNEQMRQRKAANDARDLADLTNAVTLANVLGNPDAPQVQQVFENSPTAQKNGWTGLMKDSEGNLLIRTKEGTPAYPMRQYDRRGGTDINDPTMSGSVTSYIEDKTGGPIKITPAQQLRMLQAHNKVAAVSTRAGEGFGTITTNPVTGQAAYQHLYNQPQTAKTLGPEQAIATETAPGAWRVGPQQPPATPKPPPPPRPPTEQQVAAEARKELEAQRKAAKEVIFPALANWTGRGIDEPKQQQYGDAMARSDELIRQGVPGREAGKRALLETAPKKPPAAAPAPKQEAGGWTDYLPSFLRPGPPSATVPTAPPQQAGLTPEEIARQRVQLGEAHGGLQGYARGGLGMAKMEKTMHEFKHGTLHSGSDKGPLVKERQQALAIGLNQARRADRGMAR